MRWLKLGAAALLVALIGGCGQQPRSRVYGTVRYQGKPLGGGTIVFVASDNRTYPVQIQADGSYQIDSLPRGHVQVAIQQGPPRTSPRPQLAAKGEDSSGMSAAKFDDAGPKGRRKQKTATPGGTIPPQYANSERSGLSFDLISAEQEHSIDLK
ncbi:MAG TPA: hypothetical protein VMF69_07700 [Gemmataceae bacterium]|nr:hypothetical protein [Gemmataceae bacterium]